jgi:hypothetical protein
MIIVECLFGLVFDSEEGSSTFLRNVSDYQTTQRHIPKDGKLRSCRSQNLNPDTPFSRYKNR